MMRKLLITLILLTPTCIFAQINDAINALETDSIPDLALELSEKEVQKEDKKNEKKKNNKEFYGIKTKKLFVRSQNKKIVEIFHVLPVYQSPDQYVRQIAWYSTEKRKIYYTELNKIRKSEALILHGPYEKLRNGEVIEEGFYYMGTRHGRWMSYGKDEMDRDIVLLNKTKYYKGWLKDSKRTFYDVGRKKLKEVIPIKNKLKHGLYVHYYQNGVLAEEGDYQFDQKIGIWTEYYENTQRKKEVQYPKSAFEDEEPYVLRTWTKEGKVTESERYKEQIGRKF